MKKIRFLLGVPAEVIARFGAVSAQVAGEMAQGALAAGMERVLALSVTGIAGPDGGSAGKPVGLVWFGRARAGSAHSVHRMYFAGDRAQIRLQAVRTGLELLLEGVEAWR